MSNDILENAGIEELKKGYRWEEKGCTCLFCGRFFESGVIYQDGGRLLEAEKAAAVHADSEHGPVFLTLLDSGRKTTGLTDNQKKLMLAFYEGRSAVEIAKESGLSPSTVRFQKYSLKERAKQARVFLALYEKMEEHTAKEPAAEPIHAGARMVDERYFISEKDRQKTEDAYIVSLSPLRIRAFPAAEKKKIVILRRIAALFQSGKTYAEKEVNEILVSVYGDFATIRRYLIEYGFLERTKDCSAYWVTDRPEEPQERKD